MNSLRVTQVNRRDPERLGSRAGEEACSAPIIIQRKQLLKRPVSLEMRASRALEYTVKSDRQKTCYRSLR